MIPRIEAIQLNLRSLTLKFIALPGYCVRVETSRDAGRTWTPYRECLAPESASLRLVDSVASDSFRGFLCMARRKEVCSEPRVAEIGKPFFFSAANFSLHLAATWGRFLVVV